LAKKDKRNRSDLLDLLSSSNGLAVRQIDGMALVPGKCSGPLIGGNLCMISHLVGTPFLPSLKGCLLFLEERGEALYRLDRMFTHLALSRKLRGLAGLILGEFEDCGPPSAIHELLMDRVGDMGVPVVTGLHSGHGLQNAALPIGVVAELDTELMTLSIREPCVELST
jgi:muramoyltetrapeptide carboxypeptidase